MNVECKKKAETKRSSKTSAIKDVAKFIGDWIKRRNEQKEEEDKSE